MYQSNRSFNIGPLAYPGRLTLLSSRWGIKIRVFREVGNFYPHAQGEKRQIVRVFFDPFSSRVAESTPQFHRKKSLNFPQPVLHCFFKMLYLNIVTKVCYYN